MKKKLLHCQRGLAAVEFAIMLPLLILMFLGTAELARFLILQQKIDKIAYAMADFATQASSVSTQDLDNFIATIPQILRPFPSVVVPVTFTYVTTEDNAPPPCTGAGGAPCVVWKYSPIPGGISVTGNPGGGTQLPGGLVAQARQTYLIAEVTYNYRPVIPYTGQLVRRLLPQAIYRFAIYKPRIGTLTQLNGNTR